MLADAIHQLIGSNTLQNPEGTWRLNPDITVEEFADHLGSPLDEEYAQRLVGVPERLRSKIDDLLKLGALCGELLPAGILLDYLEISDANAQDEYIDQLDEHFVGTSPPLLEDYAFTHPGLKKVP